MLRYRRDRCGPVRRPLPIAGSAGDQQAALVGHGALKPGDAKITYGTGAFLVANVGDQPVASTRRLLGTLGYQAGGRAAYALEGSIFSAGSAIQWLRDGVGMISQSRQSEAMAQELSDNGGVYLGPRLHRLGAPWWEPEARGTIVGLTRDSGPAHSSARRWRPWPIRRATCWTPWPRTGPRR